MTGRAANELPVTRFHALVAAVLAGAAGCMTAKPAADATLDATGWTYPGRTWKRDRSPAELGWSVEKLKAAKAYSATISSSCTW